MLFFIKYFFTICIILRNFASAGNLVVQPRIDEDKKIYGTLQSDYVFTCTATGDNENKPKALQWKFNGEIIEENYDQNVYSRLQDDSIMLYLQQVTQSVHGVYECSGIENGETKYVRFEFVLNQPINFVDTPIEQSIRANTDDTIVCRAIATPGPQISWVRKKVTIKNNDKYQITNEGLRIKNPTAEDEGIYTCQAFVLKTGELKNQHIQVNIKTVPKWVQLPQDIEGVRGQDVIIKCDAVAKPNPKIEFLKDGILIAGDRYFIQGSQLTIRRLENSDTGTYSCIASNDAGHVDANLRLSVLVGPVIRQFENVIVDENKDASLKCFVIEAFPPPTFRWKFADTQEFIDTNDAISIVNTDMQSEIIFKNVRKQFKRNYTCVASNKATTSEYTAGLLVRYVPIQIINKEARDIEFSWFIVDQNQNSRGASAVLTCIVDAYPLATIKWYYRNQQIIEGPKYRLLYNDHSRSQLEVTPNDETDFGIYSCVADNSNGKTIRDVNLIKSTPPTYSPTIEVGVIKPDSLQLTLRSPKNTNGGVDDFGLPVESFKIQWRLNSMDWSKPSGEIEPTVDPTLLNKDIYNLDILNLFPDTEYIFRVAAVNKPGVGKWSNDLSIRTKQRRQPDPVRMLSQEDCGFVNKCILEWSPEGNGGSTILEYYLKYRKVFYSDGVNLVKGKVGQWSDIFTIKTGITKYELINLESNTFYEIDVIARNEIGLSASQPYRVKTMIGSENLEYADARRITNLNMGLIIAGCIIGFFILLLTIDLCCYFTNKCGILMSMKNSVCCKKTKDKSKPIFKEPKYEGVPQDA